MKNDYDYDYDYDGARAGGHFSPVPGEPGLAVLVP